VQNEENNTPWNNLTPTDPSPPPQNYEQPSSDSAQQLD
jgi:hypothetical protein